MCSLIRCHFPMSPSVIPVFPSLSFLYLFSNSLTILAPSFPSFACPERSRRKRSRRKRSRRKRSRRIGRGEGALGMPLALTRGRGYDHDGEPPCSMDGWLYPTYPPLTKGGKRRPFFLGSPLVGSPSFCQRMTEPLQSPTLSFCHPRRLSPTFPPLSSSTLVIEDPVSLLFPSHMPQQPTWSS